MIEIEELLIKNKIITEEQLYLVKEQMLVSNLDLPTTLQDLNFCNEIEILNLYKSVYDLDYEIEEELNNLLDKMNISGLKNGFYNKEKDKYEYIEFNQETSEKREQVILDYDPLKKIVIVATSSFNNIATMNETKEYFKKRNAKTVFIGISNYNLSIIRQGLYSENEYKEQIKELTNDENYVDNLDKIIRLIVEEAIIANASDIYISDNVSKEISYVYFRVKREKSIQYVFKTEILEKILAKIQNDSNMESGRKNGHQDGSFSIKILNDKYTISIRVNTSSTIAGSNTTMRLQENMKKLTSLGFEEEDETFIRKILKKKKGIILLVGPTGSGKTTTIYAILNEYNPHKEHIVTIEDPVEIIKDGLHQIQINNDAGQSFTNTLRALMRQAPDVVLLGEIRDKETAEKAMEISNTGHLVLATIHANGVKTVQDRLEQLNVDKTKVFMQSISCSIYQELKNNKLCYEISRNGDLENVKRVNLD